MRQTSRQTFQVLRTLPILLTGIVLGATSLQAGSPAPSLSDCHAVDTAEVIDRSDLAWLFGHLGITKGRYTIEPGEERFALDFVLVAYEKGVKVGERTTSGMILQGVPAQTEQQAKLILRQIHENMAVDSTTREIRIYVDQGTSGLVEFDLVVDGATLRMPATVDTSRLGSGGAHPFLFTGIASGEQVPLMAVYYVAAGERFLPCPADAPPEIVAARYRLVYIVYARAVPLD